MRYVLAIAALVVAGVLLVLGIGQRTFLAPPSEVTIPVDTKSDIGYLTIASEQFSEVHGQPNVVVKGTDAFVSSGATRDVEAWLKPFPHAEVSINGRDDVLTMLTVGAAKDSDKDSAAKPLDPRGSDLWLEARSIRSQGSETEKQTLRVPVSPDKGQTVLIASNGVDPLPSEVSLVWVQDRNTPWAGPLLAAGGFFALLGGLLYLLAVDRDRRSLGPRRGRRGPFLGIRNELARSKKLVGKGADPAPTTVDMVSAAHKRRSLRHAVAIPALGLTAVLALSGCSASYWPDFSAQPEPDVTTEVSSTGLPPVPVTESQMDRIVDQISEVAGVGDDTLDSAELEARFVGDALQQRAANYAIRKAIPEYPVVPPRISKDRLDYELVQSTESWPRTMFVTVASSTGKPSEVAEGDKAAPASSPSLAMILTQETPQDNYHVSRVIALRGGISMPQAAPAEEGTALLANDIETLVLSPGEVGTAFAAVLQNGKNSAEAASFDLSGDTIIDNYGSARALKAQQESDAKGQTMKFSAQLRQGDQPPVALSTGVGGALVATTVIEEQIVDAAGGRFKPQAAGAVTALSGLSGEQDRVVQRVAHQLLFYVPSKTDDAKVQLLGVTSELVEAGN